jgi:hypothetical protein
VYIYIHVDIRVCACVFFTYSFRGLLEGSLLGSSHLRKFAICPGSWSWVARWSKIPLEVWQKPRNGPSLRDCPRMGNARDQFRRLAVGVLTNIYIYTDISIYIYIYIISIVRWVDLPTHSGSRDSFVLQSAKIFGLDIPVTGSRGYKYLQNHHPL